MLSKEVKQYCSQAIVRLIDGDKDGFKRLTRIAMQMNGTYNCQECGHLTVPAKIKNKHINKRVEICTKCGLIQNTKIHVRSLAEKVV